MTLFIGFKILLIPKIKKRSTFALMLFRLRKNISFFILIVFLFPIITEAVHTHEHQNDFHCTEKNTRHLHVAEHHCSICDFLPLSSNAPIHYNHLSFSGIFTNAIFSFYKTIALIKHSYNFSLRAPPAIS